MTDLPPHHHQQQQNQVSAATDCGQGQSSGGDTGYGNSPEASRVQRSSNHFSTATPASRHTAKDLTVASAASANVCLPGSRNFTLSPETTDCDSAEIESEVSVNEGSFHSSGPRMQTSMPVLEDGLSSGHASDLEEDVIYSR